MTSEFFRELENEAYFRQVRVFFRGIGWPNGQDFMAGRAEVEMLVLAYRVMPVGWVLSLRSSIDAGFHEVWKKRPRREGRFSPGVD